MKNLKTKLENSLFFSCFFYLMAFAIYCLSKKFNGLIPAALLMAMIFYSPATWLVPPGEHLNKHYLFISYIFIGFTLGFLSENKNSLKPKTLLELTFLFMKTEAFMVLTSAPIFCLSFIFDS